MAICLKDVQDYVQRSKDALKVAATMITHQYWSDTVSKAYYAMFYVANAILLTKEISVSKHSAVISIFGEQFAKTNVIDRRFHREFIDAFDDRQKSDYGPRVLITPEDARHRLKAANEFVDAAINYLQKEGWL